MVSETNSVIFIKKFTLPCGAEVFADDFGIDAFPIFQPVKDDMPNGLN